MESKGKNTGLYRVLKVVPEGMTPLGIHTHGREDNLEMYLQEIGWGGGSLDWIDVLQDRDQEMDRCREGVKLRVPKFGDSLTS